MRAVPEYPPGAKRYLHKERVILMKCSASVFRILVLLLITGGVIGELTVVCVWSQPAPVATATPSATPTIPLPPEVEQVLARYAQAFEQEDPEIFASCFWDARSYLPLFQDVCRDWFDIQVRYLQIRAYAGSRKEELLLSVRIQSRMRENRTRQLVRLVSTAEFVLEQRDKQWRILSIRTATEKPSREP